MTATTAPTTATGRRWALPSIAALVVAGLVVTGAALGMKPGSNGGAYQSPNISAGIAAVTCADAKIVDDEFTRAAQDVTQSGNYDGITKFGFTAPATAPELKTLNDTLKTRKAELDAKADAVVKGTCTDSPTATVTDVDGKTKTLAIIYGGQPDKPITGSESNRDARTVPVTTGTSADAHRTNSWSELDGLYGKEKWYTDCANSNLAMNWDTDVPKFVATEKEHDDRFILAVNTSLNDDAIRQKAASDGNPNVGTLPIVRVDSIINTRHLNINHCDQFIDARSMVRVSLGKVTLDEKEQFKDIETDNGAFVDCHNLWRLPKSKPIPTPIPTPSQSTHGSTPPPGTTTPPTSPPTTTQKCIPSEHENENGKCIESKISAQGCADGTKVCASQGGPNPPAPSTTEPRPSDPPTSYDPHPTTHQPTVTHTPTQPVETPAPKPSAPATGVKCPPGIPKC